MKKILCALTAAIILAVQCAAYAETEAVNDNAADSDIQLAAVPVGDITGDGALTPDEKDKITEAMLTAFETAEPPEDISDENPAYITIEIPEDIEITLYDSSTGAEENYSKRFTAAEGIVRNYLADNPKYFYLNRIGCSYDNNNKVKSLNIRYSRNAAEIEKIQSELGTVTNEIIMQMSLDGVNLDAITNENSTAEEKAQAQFDAALWLHDYLADTITYDERAYDPTAEAEVERTIDAALLDDCLTVCEGYANAYKYILEKIGMKCVNVYSDTDYHEWSAVNIGDAWYYVDVTQDDDDGAKWVNHSYFLVTEEELLGGGGTHADGYITEIDESTMTFGKEFEGKLWHGTWQEVPAVGEEGAEGEEGEEGTEGEGEESEPKLEWQDSVISTRVVFDGNDRYYCGFDDTARKSVIYKCGADLTSPEEFYVISDGVWYVDPEDVTPRRSIFDYLGGLGKYTYEATGENAEKTCLYFNSPAKIYELELGKEEAQPEVVYTYVPEEGKNYNCASICGLSTYDTLKYQIMDLIPNEDQTIDFEYVGENEETIACSVYLYNGTEQPELMDILTYPEGVKLNVPDYKPYGIVIKGWVKDLANNTLWDFANDDLTESVRLYADVEAAHWKMQPLLKVSENCLTGTVNASVADFDDTYREAPKYILAVYDNNTLAAVKMSGTGEFELTAEDNIPYTETTTVKVYAWSSENEPYLGSAPVRIQKPSGEGEEGEGETGDGEEGGSDEGEESGGGEGSETGGSEGEGDNGNENEGGGETGDTGSETGSGETGENTGE